MTDNTETRESMRDWERGTVNANGVQLQYYRTGSGPPIVMAHGYYENGRTWGRLARDLATDYEVVTYDARGHGQSDAPEDGYGVDDRVADLIGLVDELGLSEPILYGHSMGGSTAAWAATEHAEPLRGLVLEDPAGLHGEPEIGPEERVSIVEDRIADWQELSLSEIAAEHTEYGEDLAHRIAQARTECQPEIAAIQREGFPPLAEAFEDITCPTLVLKSDESEDDRAATRAVTDRLSDGRLVHVDEAGHYVVWSQYEDTITQVESFLDRLDADGS
jgi:pimeloyl-ACP methyl ester carboxylesterase